MAAMLLYTNKRKESLREFHILLILFRGPTNSGGPPQKFIFYADTTNGGNRKIEG